MRSVCGQLAQPQLDALYRCGHRKNLDSHHLLSRTVQEMRLNFTSAVSLPNGTNELCLQE